MSDPWDQTWSNSSTAPPIPKSDYTLEKAIMAGCLISSILYGLLTLLFFQCMVALVNPVHRRGERIKLWLVFYTMAMFSFVTVYTAMNLNNLSMSFIDNRVPIEPDFSGPVEYYIYIPYTPLGLLPNVMFNLNNWLADGLLIYRCYIIYSTNLWAITLPCLMYLASFGMGIVSLCFQFRMGVNNSFLGFSKFGIAYVSISVSLNVLLTLMIVIRLILHARKVRNAIGSLAGISRLCKTISTMFVESCALFTVGSILVIGALATYLYNWDLGIYIVGEIIMELSLPILAEIQVIAPLLIIQRVANGSALTGPTVTTGRTTLFNVRGQGGPADNGGVPLCTCLNNPTAGYGKNPGEPGVVVRRTTGLHPDGNA